MKLKTGCSRWTSVNKRVMRKKWCRSVKRECCFMENNISRNKNAVCGQIKELIPFNAKRVSYKHTSSTAGIKPLSPL